MLIKAVYFIEKIKKKDCLFHLAYQLKIEIYAKIVYII